MTPLEAEAEAYVQSPNRVKYLTNPIGDAFLAGAAYMRDSAEVRAAIDALERFKKQLEKSHIETP